MRQWGMPTRPYTDFNKALGRAIKTFRERRDLTQAQVAHVLQIDLEKYKKYENRSPLPHFYIPAICTLLNIKTDELFAAALRLASTKQASHPTKTKKTSLAS